MNSKKDLRNCLVQYQGGGYDGCIWEWNYFLLDSEKKFNNIFSSGHNGVKDEKDFQKFNFDEPDVYIYDLTNKEEMKDFVIETNENDVLYVAKVLYDEFDYELKGFCDKCKQEFTLAEGHHTGYKGDGGIGIVYTGMVCESCYYTYSCNRCEEFVGSEGIKYNENGSFCGCCFEKEFKKFPFELTNRVLFDKFEMNLDELLENISTYFPESILREINSFDDLDKIMLEKFEMEFRPLDENNKKLYGFFKVGYEWLNPNQLSLF